MKKLINNKNILNVIMVIVLMLLPYYIFGGKYFLGGDDTRLFYTYPMEFIKNVSFFSWHNLSSLGINSSDQYILPFMSIWLILNHVIPSAIAVTYFAFSLPLILGFLFFQKAIRELLNLDQKYDIEIFLGSLFYVLSPILIINQMFVFLTAICLVGVIPMNVYLFVRYLKTSNFKYVLVGAIATMFLAGILYTLPWIFGFLLPVSLGVIVISFFYSFKQKINFIKKCIIYFGFMAFTQSYWLATFIPSYFSADSNSFAQKFVSKGYLDTFTPTILTTATGNIFYPLLNLFHRQIAMDFSWKLLDVFKNFYDKTFILNLIFIGVLFGGVVGFKKYYSKDNKKIFIFLLITMIISLFLFTVNIGPLKDLFLFFGKIPGFLMFRNFYDKFAPAFVLLYSFVITACLVVVKQKFPKKYPLIAIAFFIIVIINFIPVKATVNSPLWRTESINRMIIIPNEYLSFMSEIRNTVPSTNTILSLPFGTSTYTVIKDKDSESVDVGISPVRIFSGVNDISGHYSFNYTDEANSIDKLIIDSDYSALNKVFYRYNVNYVFVTKNVPDQAKKSYIFDPAMLKAQNAEFLKQITGKKLLTSSNDNYELYQMNKVNSLIVGNNVYFQKVSPVKYKILIKNLKNKETLDFNDSYHGEWRLFPGSYSKDLCADYLEHDINKYKNVFECKPRNILFEKEDLRYGLSRDVFRNTHSLLNGFANQWVIDPKIIKADYPESYKINSDGSMDVSLTLYFLPQNYFYYGVFISVFVIILGAAYAYKKRK